MGVLEWGVFEVFSTLLDHIDDDGTTTLLSTNSIEVESDFLSFENNTYVENVLVHNCKSAPILGDLKVTEVNFNFRSSENDIRGVDVFVNDVKGGFYFR
jgi:hypothetical protein